MAWLAINAIVLSDMALESMVYMGEIFHGHREIQLKVEYNRVVKDTSYPTFSFMFSNSSFSFGSGPVASDGKTQTRYEGEGRMVFERSLQGKYMD
jgi:hypothetical protein